MESLIILREFLEDLHYYLSLGGLIVLFDVFQGQPNYICWSH